jgi:hypothetical protein
MQVPITQNPVLSRKWNNMENEYMNRKINTAKPDINFQIPESFAFSKSKPKKNLKNYSKINFYNLM